MAISYRDDHGNLLADTYGNARIPADTLGVHLGDTSYDVVNIDQTEEVDIVTVRPATEQTLGVGEQVVPASYYNSQILRAEELCLRAELALRAVCASGDGALRPVGTADLVAAKLVRPRPEIEGGFILRRRGMSLVFDALMQAEHHRQDIMEHMTEDDDAKAESHEYAMSQREDKAS